MPDPDDAFRFCVCGWDGHVNECPKDAHFGFSRCPKCGSMVGTGLCIGRRAARMNYEEPCEDDWPDCGCGEPGCNRCHPECHYCHGDGFGIVGLDWDCHDGVNGPYEGETERCPCCGGSGKGEDETFW